MRFQRDQMASMEAEARWQFTGRWSVVGFGGAGATRTTRDAFVTTQNVGSAGVGVRYELARKFGLHAGMDVAHSPGTTAVTFRLATRGSARDALHQQAVQAAAAVVERGRVMAGPRARRRWR